MCMIRLDHVLKIHSHHSRFNTFFKLGGVCKQLKSKRVSTLDSYDYYILDAILKLEIVIYVFC